MDRNTLVNTSKRMSWLLRHGAKEAGIAIDSAGWTDVDEVLRKLRISRESLDAVVAQNDKKRFEVSNGRVRAVQGHSAAVVSTDALEESWDRYEGNGSVWHGTNLKALEGIRHEGIRPRERSHVHLAPTPDSRVGKRQSVDVLLEVSTEHLRQRGVELWQAPNGVVLARTVPAECIVGVLPVSRHGRSRAASVIASLGFEVRLHEQAAG